VIPINILETTTQERPSTLPRLFQLLSAAATEIAKGSGLQATAPPLPDGSRTRRRAVV